MITEGYFRRHTQAYGGNREVALLDVAQEYVIEYMRRESLFDDLLIFKGGTALRKFVFGVEGRFSVDLDFALRHDDPSHATMVLDMLDGAELGGVKIRLDRRKGSAATLRLETPLGPVTEPAAVSIRPQQPWLPALQRTPMPFDFLDRGLQPEFVRAPLPILDLREIAAEKIAAFWRRRKARDLYDLENLGRALQANFDGPGIAALAVLKIYFDVMDEGLGRPLPSLGSVFGCAGTEITGADDLGHFRASTMDAAQLLSQYARRYVALVGLEDDLASLVTTCNRRDRWRALQLRDEVVTTITGRR